MTYSLTGAFFLAPKYLVPVDEKESVEHGGPAGFHWRTLDEGSILPVFTSLESFLNFVQIYYAGEGSTQPIRLNLKVLRSATTHAGTSAGAAPRGWSFALRLPGSSS